MFPPIFTVCKDSAPVAALLGSAPMRLYPFAEAEQGAARPYAVWQIVSGNPENYITGRPDIDRFGLQVDVYADSVDDAREVAAALRDAIEPHAHITAWRGESREADTRLYRVSFDLDWFTPR